MTDGALAAGATNAVPVTGQVAGHGYGYWLQRNWQAIFGSSAAASPCRSLTANGRRVAYLTIKTLGPGTHHYTCTVPAGRPLYVNELSAECSTFKGDHGNFGTSASQLKQCARALFKGAKATGTVDRQSVNLNKLIATTGVYPVRIPKNSAFGLPPGKGRSAAHGFGLLLTGFPKGTHIIHSRASIGGSKFDTTYTVHAN
jgi:hypothetical protein